MDTIKIKQIDPYSLFFKSIGVVAAISLVGAIVDQLALKIFILGKIGAPTAYMAGTCVATLLLHAISDFNPWEDKGEMSAKNFFWRWMRTSFWILFSAIICFIIFSILEKSVIFLAQYN